MANRYKNALTGADRIYNLSDYNPPLNRRATEAKLNYQ